MLQIKKLSTVILTSLLLSPSAVLTLSLLSWPDSMSVLILFLASIIIFLDSEVILNQIFLFCAHYYSFNVYLLILTLSFREFIL